MNLLCHLRTLAAELRAGYLSLRATGVSLYSAATHPRATAVTLFWKLDRAFVVSVQALIRRLNNLTPLTPGEEGVSYLILVLVWASIPIINSLP